MQLLLKWLPFSLVLLASAPCNATDNELVLPPGLEQMFESLLPPQALETRGWQLGDISIQHNEARYALQREDRSCTLVLRPPVGSTCHRSKNFEMHIEGQCGLDRAALLDQLSMLIGERDTGKDPWIRAATNLVAHRPDRTKSDTLQARDGSLLYHPAHRQSLSGLNAIIIWAIRSCMLLSSLLLVLCHGRIKQALLGTSAFDLGFLAACSLITCGLALWGASRVPGWINGHGYELLRDVLLDPPTSPDPHGMGFIAFHGLIQLALPGREMTVVCIQIASTLLSIPLLYFVALQIWGDPVSARWSAASYAAMPSVCFFASSEVHQVPGNLFMLASLAALGLACRAWRDDRRPHGLALIAAALLGAISAQFYPFYLLMPVILLVLLLAASPGLLNRGWTWISAGLLVMLCAPSALWMLYLVCTGQGVFGPDFLGVLGEFYHVLTPGYRLEVQWHGNIFLNLFFTSPLLPLAAAVGISSQGRKALLVLLCAFLLTIPGLMDGRTNTARLQLPAQPFYALLAGAGLGCVMAWLKRHIRWRKFAQDLALSSVLLVLLVAWPGMSGMRFTPQMERDAFAEGLTQLESGCLVIWPPHPNGPINPLPYYLALEQGKQLSWASIVSQVPEDLMSRARCIYYYRPATCSQKERGAEICAGIEFRLELEPVFVRRLPAEPDYLQDYLSDRVEVGFFRVKGLSGSAPGSARDR
ncbi:MAG: hypothetical protein JXR96_29615 [Deltaproteobacteria bacterium]|nr:hypothetical protein [Deltaproteobacteria bacterium]